MADISMCMNSGCPNFGHCYRAQAVPSEHWQSYMDFQYTMTMDGVHCDNYWPTNEVYKVESGAARPA